MVSRTRTARRQTSALRYRREKGDGTQLPDIGVPKELRELWDVQQHDHVPRGFPRLVVAAFMDKQVALLVS